jgi:hypothetical protein
MLTERELRSTNFPRRDEETTPIRAPKIIATTVDTPRSKKVFGAYLEIIFQTGCLLLSELIPFPQLPVKMFTMYFSNLIGQG